MAEFSVIYRPWEGQKHQVGTFWDFVQLNVFPMFFLIKIKCWDLWVWNWISSFNLSNTITIRVLELDSWAPIKEFVIALAITSLYLCIIKYNHHYFVLRQSSLLRMDIIKLWSSSKTMIKSLTTPNFIYFILGLIVVTNSNRIVSGFKTKNCVLLVKS